MRIYIIANFVNKQTSRFVELAERFSSKGHDVTMITSDFDHLEKKTKTVKHYSDNFKSILLHEPYYPNNVSIKRLYSHYYWGHEVAKFLKSSTCPDVIYCAIPSLTVGSEIVDYCKNNSAKLVIDIQDLWPEAFCLMIKNKLLQLAFKPMEWLVNKTYSNADFIIGVSDTYRDRGLRVNNKGKKGLTVFLGNGLEGFDKGKRAYHTDRPSDQFWIAYIGTIGYSYDIPCVIDAISTYNIRKESGPKVKLIAMGRGPLIEKFTQYAKDKNVDVQFTGRLPYEKMVGLMCSCDVVVNPIRKGAAQSITNKVGDYAFSGLAVINTQECQEYRDLVEQYECGINCECGNSIQVAEAIKQLIENPELRMRMGDAARKLGEEKFDRNCTYPLIVQSVERLVYPEINL